ncbi:MAG: polysulfide reductase NrfD [Deltaproteobacteria bacterium]|nr:polysulfide reductase NrfD [Deltaproteobacteria bacterium]MBW2071025.1 polysulfide reductase NrfD [Deltaproteobacteria bacterium]
MFETALKGSKKYWGLLFLLFGLHGLGASCFLYQLSKGLTITGMSRDVSWGLYIAQFTFLVGVAASAVMVVLPYYLHNVKEFGKITILGEFLAIASVSMCLMFILVDLGKPMRALNVILHPTPNSILFWDMIVLNGYLFLNLLIGWTVLAAERKQVKPPAWIKPFIYLSIPWAVSIHTVTAFLYAGLPGRHFWLTAIMAARFLGSAFAAGPALLILLCMIVRKVSKFDPGEVAIQKLTNIVLYATIISIFFVILELFTAFYSQIPGHTSTFVYLFTGLHGHSNLVAWWWAFVVLILIATLMLLTPSLRQNDTTLAIACAMVFLSLWIEKGITLVIAGFIPDPFEKITEYAPTPPEIGITLGVWATGFLILTVLYKIAITVKEETA